jgi:hypothetical protein
MMKAKAVLFLDFDGVLHPNGCDPADCFCLLPALVETIRPFELDIVISSSWRFHHSLRYLRKLFPATVRDRIVGTTGEPFPGPNARWEEIQAYLLERPAANWRALDDFDWEFPPDCTHLIHCDGARGCQGPELSHLGSWLGQGAA